MTHHQILALLQTVKRITRQPIRVAKRRAYAVIGVPGARQKMANAHEVLDVLKEDGLQLICEPQARKNADIGMFEYVGVKWK